MECSVLQKMVDGKEAVKLPWRLERFVGFAVVGMIIFLFVQAIVQQFVEFIGIPISMGLLFIAIILAAFMTIMLIQKGFAVDKNSIFAIVIIMLVIIALIVVFPMLLGDSLFSVHAFELRTAVQSVIPLP